MKLFKIIAPVWLLCSACSGQHVPASINLQFEPAAFRSDEFSTGPTDVTVVGGCVVPDNIDTFKVRAFSTAITDSDEKLFTVDDIDQATCTLNIPLPPNADIDLVIKAFNVDGALVRKAVTKLPPFEDGENVVFPTPLWPAKRMDDLTGGENGAVDLQYIEIMRQFDQFIIELAFDEIVFPATRGGENSLNGFFEITNTDDGSLYTMLIDAAEAGLQVVGANSTTPERAEFEFIVGGVQIGLPYAVVGGSAGNGTEIDAPSIDFSLTLHDSNDADPAILDIYPESGVDSFK